MFVLGCSRGGEQAVLWSSDPVSGIWRKIDFLYPSDTALIEVEGNDGVVFTYTEAAVSLTGYSNNLGSQSPTFKKGNFLTAGKITKGWVVGYNGLDLHSPLGTKTRTILSTTSVKGRALELGDFIIIISSRNSKIKILDKKTYSDYGDITVESKQGDYVLTDGDRVVRLSINRGKAHTALKSELTLAKLPTISVSNAYCYIRGK